MAVIDIGETLAWTIIISVVAISMATAAAFDHKYADKDPFWSNKHKEGDKKEDE